MIKAVFFDWFNTLAHFDPPREVLHSQAFRENGIDITPEQIKRGLLLADSDWFEANAQAKISERNPQEQLELFLRYEERILKEAGFQASKESLLKVIKRARELYQGLTFTLFDDVLPALKTMKEHGFILGLVTNVDRDMNLVSRRLGLEGNLDFIVTSKEAGADKPELPIFKMALERAGVEAKEAAHVGDQYKLDVVGARGAGIKPILIDRFDLNPEVSDCPRIHRLSEVIYYL